MRTYSAAEVFEQQIKDETQFQSWLNSILREAGWLENHPYDSRRSSSGLPDTTAVHPERIVLLFTELKVGKNKPTPKQKAWLAALRALAKRVNDAVGRQVIIVRLWYPSDYEDIRKIVWGRIL